jgi:hypothetical protein
MLIKLPSLAGVENRIYKTEIVRRGSKEKQPWYTLWINRKSYDKVLSNPTSSESQRRLFSIAYGIKTGKIPRSYSPEAAKIADDMPKSKIRDFMKLANPTGFHIEGVYFQPISRLYEPGETVRPIYCEICKKERMPVRYANIELTTRGDKESYCNLAVLLHCGHVMVDDCEKGYNGMFFSSVKSMVRKILNKPSEPLDLNFKLNPQRSTCILPPQGYRFFDAYPTERYAKEMQKRINEQYGYESIVRKGKNNWHVLVKELSIKIQGEQNPILETIGAGAVSGIGLGLGFKTIDTVWNKLAKKKNPRQGGK